MIAAALGLFGPLALPECLRASRRRWLPWIRLAPALGAGLVVLLFHWIWATFRDFDAAYMPYAELRAALAAVVGSLVALAGLIPPAVLAGSLAGEKERGSIALLLSTQAGAAEIVLGRWVGRLAPVALVAAAALPGLIWLAALAGLDGAVAATLVILPLAVGLGGGGFALGVSAASRRGRDALLVVYLLEVVLMLGAMVAPPPARAIPRSSWPDLRDAIGPGMFNPFAPLGPLIWGERIAPAVATALAWSLLGLAGLGVASWRLRPSCLEDGSGSGRSMRRRAWGHRVPPVGGRPMLWKELHIERAGSLGRVGRWVGGLLVAWLALGSLALAALAIRDAAGPGPAVADGGTIAGRPGAVAMLAAWYGRSATWISFLIQWAIGLRAGVAIASERERGTWDALLTSPLEGVEIVRGKLWGSLHALRWLIAAALLAWTITWACNGMGGRAYAALLAETACWSALMAAGGVAISLRAATATRAMGLTLAAWLAAYLALRVVAFFACLLAAGACLAGWMVALQVGLVGVSSPVWYPMPFRPGMEVTFCGAAALLAALLVAETRVRFDRVAGRMTGGVVAARFDEFLHGRPLPPARVDSPAPGRRGPAGG